MTCPSCGAENASDAAFCEECGAQLKTAPAPAVAVAVREGPLPEGELLESRYRVEAVLESGRINRYRVSDEQADQERLMLEGPQSDPGYFETQSELLEKVEDEGIWRPDEVLRAKGRDYLLGPLPGRTLHCQVSSDGALPPQEVRNLGLALCRTLEAMHDAGLLHRSIQPDRVWLTGEPEAPCKLDCFGRLCSQENGQANYEVTTGFSAPECYGMQGGVVDQRSDVYGLGASLHFALTADRADLEARETFFSFSRPQVSGDRSLVDAIMKAVTKAPDGRFESVAGLARALQGTTAEADSAAGPASGSSAGSATVLLDTPARGYQTALRSDRGCVRSVNQDACLELRFASIERDRRQDAHLVAIIDGMGGEAEGDKAASLALRSLAQEVVNTFLTLQNSRATAPLLPQETAERNRTVLRRALENANRVIYEYARLDPNRRGMGCTITAVLLDGEKAFFGHVGDTRAYLFRDGPDLITTDHSLVGRLVEMGQMTVEEARVSPQRSIIYRALGTNAEVEVDVYERSLQVGDMVMVSCDGVWEYFEQSELASIFASLNEPAEICDRLVDICLERGADDNATVAVIKALG